MGNIQIKERQKRGQSIFGQRQKSQSKSPSPFREAVSPKNPIYKHFSPIKYTRTKTTVQRYPINEQKIDRINSSRLQRDDINRSYTKLLNNERRALDRSLENKLKCQQIIKKVRNFNDFLVELKRKLNDDGSVKKQQSSLKRQISMNVKLENQKVQLQKYKRLVERELSKTHSIENISIQNSDNGQKVLTIHYQNFNQTIQKSESNKSEQMIKFQISQDTPQLQYKEDEQLYRIPPYVRQKQQNKISISNINQYQQKLYRQAKTLITVLKERCNLLTTSINQEYLQQNDDKTLQTLMKLKEKNVKMQGLLQNLEEANTQSLKIQRKLRKLTQ